jgi:hypothetical protein
MAFQTRHLRIAVVAAAFACAAGSAVAQEEPYRSKTPAPKAPATSTLEATAPTAAETREAQALTAAIFAKPAAAARAADKVAAENQPDLAPAAVQPKPEWSAEEGLRPGGKGVEIKTPF